MQQSSNIDNGSIITKGGMGINKDVNIGGSLAVQGYEGNMPAGNRFIVDTAASQEATLE